MAKKPKQQELKPNLNPDDAAACFSEYASLRGDIARLNQKIAATLGRYEKQGVDPKAVKHAYQQSQKDPAEIAATERKNAEYLRMLGIIDTDRDGQGTFAKGLTVAMPSVVAAAGLAAARSHADGYNTGLAGGRIDACRHPTGSEEFVAWRDGWQDGHADRIARKPDADKVVKADARRGRKKANGAPPHKLSEGAETHGTA